MTRRSDRQFRVAAALISVLILLLFVSEQWSLSPGILLGRAAVAPVQSSSVQRKANPSSCPTCAAAHSVCPSLADEIAAAVAAAAAANTTPSSAPSACERCPSCAACARPSTCPAPPLPLPSRGGVPLNSAALGADEPARSSPWVTRQLCHQLDDDSEFCVYDGPICIADNAAIAVGVDVPPVPSDPDEADAWRRAWRLGVREPRFSGPADHRYFDFTSPRSAPRVFDDGGARDAAPRFVGDDAANGDVLPFPVLPVAGRQYGPLGGRGRIIQMPAANIAAATTRADADALGARWASTLNETAAGARPINSWVDPSASSYEIGYPPNSITWLTGSLYVSDICVTCFEHPWHAAIAWGNLWAIRRMNASSAPSFASPSEDTRLWREGRGAAAAAAAAADNSGHNADTDNSGHNADTAMPPSLAYTSSSGYAFPSVDNFYVRGESPRRFHNASSLSPWNRELLRLWLPSSARLWFQDHVEEVRASGRAQARVQREEKERLDAAAVAARARSAPDARSTPSSSPTPTPSRNPEHGHHWICAPRGVILGEKSGVFSGVRDAHALRVAAYARVGLDPNTAWRARPPQTITLVQRPKSRKFVNGDALEALLRATGLPMRVVADPGALSWAEQVKLFAGTGILVSAHGGVLANLMFMPVHAAVIEIFPYPFAVQCYGRLAGVCRLHYYAVKGLHRPSETAFSAFTYKEVNGSAFVTQCDGGVALRRAAAAAAAASGGNISTSSESGSAGLIHYSTLDISLVSHCNPWGKLSDIEVPLRELQWAVDAALDDVGCRDSICRVGRDDTQGTSEAPVFAVRIPPR